jgi:hypothetical protein
MLRMRGLLAFVLVLGVAAPIQASGDKIVTGHWKVSAISGTSEITSFLLKLDRTDGKLVASLQSLSPRLKGDYTLKSFTVEGNIVRAIFKTPTAEQIFEGVIGSDNKKILGSLSTETLVQPAYLTATDVNALDAKNSFSALDVPPLKEAQTLSSQASQLLFKAQQTKDAEQKATLLKEYQAAVKRFQAETPRLYRETIAKHSDSPAVVTAVMSLLRGLSKDKAPAAEVKNWAEAANKIGKAHGPRMQREIHLQLATALVNQSDLAALALENARAAEKLLDAQSSVDTQVRVLNLLGTALSKTGSANEAKTIAMRVTKLDEVLDREYLTKVPSFKGTPFAGRTAKSDRVVVMELFTGAECPPCVAADVAFDVLLKSYKTSELVLIQYHVHIPRPDPLTNSDTEARWAYYRKAFPEKVRGAPTSIFNGTPDASGGGSMAAAERKFEQYRGIIDPLLETPASARIVATANRQNDKIAIDVKVSGLDNPGADKKLRIVLVEENIRYVGGNKIRFHHQVVRAMPGGAGGFELKGKDNHLTTSVDVPELRKQLNNYLDNFVATKGPFPNANRPLSMDHLRVIAFVQDDATHEILQATQVEIANVNGGR